MKKLFLLITSAVLGLTICLSATPALALLKDASSEACKGVQLNQTDADTCDPNTESAPANGLLRLAINIFSLVVGVIAVIMVIVGGVKYVTSSGDSSNVNSAKNTILYALVGLVVVALAQVIVRFVIRKAAPAPECQVPAAQQPATCK